MRHMKSIGEVSHFSGDSELAPISEFLKLYKVTQGESSGDCPSGEDCSELVSSCCGAILTTVFGTLPLEVSCTECGSKYLLRDVISQ